MASSALGTAALGTKFHPYPVTLHSATSFICVHVIHYSALVVDGYLWSCLCGHLGRSCGIFVPAVSSSSMALRALIFAEGVNGWVVCGGFGVLTALASLALLRIMFRQALEVGDIHVPWASPRVSTAQPPSHHSEFIPKESP